MIHFKRTQEKGVDFLRSIAELFDDWAGTYDEEIDDIGGPLTGYRDSIKKAHKNYPEAAENVLDIGIGTGNFIAEYIEDAKNVYGVDISTKMLEEAKKKFPSIKVETGDFNNIPFESDYFDLITSSFVFHEVPLSKREDAFKEVSRLLKQGGTLNLLDIGFNNKSDMEEAKEKYREEWDDSEQYPFEYELRQYAEDAGLTVDKIDYPSGLHINLIASKR